MLNKKEKEIIKNYIKPLLTKWKDNFFGIEHEREWYDIREELKGDIVTIEGFLDSIYYEKNVKLSGSGVLKRYGKLEVE